MKKHTLESYIEIITGIYKGYTAAGVADKMGITEAAVTTAASSVGIGFYKIRTAKRNGITLETLIEEFKARYNTKQSLPASAKQDDFKKLMEMVEVIYQKVKDL